MQYSSEQSFDQRRRDNLIEKGAELEQLLPFKGTTPNVSSAIRTQKNNEGYGFMPQSDSEWSDPYTLSTL